MAIYFTAHIPTAGTFSVIIIRKNCNQELNGYHFPLKYRRLGPGKEEGRPGTEIPRRTRVGDKDLQQSALFRRLFRKSKLAFPA